MGRTGCGENGGPALVGRVVLSKILMQVSADGWGCAPSLLVVWPEEAPSWSLLVLCYGRAYGDLQEDLCQDTYPRAAAANALVPTVGHC